MPDSMMMSRTRQYRKLDRVPPVVRNMYLEETVSSAPPRRTQGAPNAHSDEKRHHYVCSERQTEQRAVPYLQGVRECTMQVLCLGEVYCLCEATD